MRTVSPSIPHLNDDQLENAIDRAHRALVTRSSLKGKAKAWRWLSALIKARSPEAIRRLEEQRGLVRRS